MMAGVCPAWRLRAEGRAASQFLRVVKSRLNAGANVLHWGLACAGFVRPSAVRGHFWRRVERNQERLSWAAIEGGSRLNAERSERCWTVVHTQYAFCVVTRGAADWSYRGHRFTVIPGKVYVLEPGEVHTTVRTHTAGDFSVSFLDPEWMSRFSSDLANLKEPHFLPGGVESFAAWRGLVECSLLDPVRDHDELNERMSQSLVATLRAGSRGGALTRVLKPSKPALERAKRALMDRYLSAPAERIRLDEVVLELGMGYHRFVHEFSLQFGAAPYQYVKMLRAQYVFDQLRSGPSRKVSSLTALARHAGYSDMPHMSRELRLHFGVAPRELARQLNPEWLKRTLWRTDHTEQGASRDADSSTLGG